MEAIRRVRDAGFEIGVYGWDAVRWPRRAGDRRGWNRRCAARASASRRSSASRRATHAAPWLAHEPARLPAYAAARLPLLLGHARHRTPFIPLCDGELIACPQLPTTLADVRRAARPRRDHLRHRAPRASEAERGARRRPDTSSASSPTARATRLAPVLERLLDGLAHPRLRDRGLARAAAESLEPKGARAPRGRRRARRPERAEGVAVQGAVFLRRRGEVAPAIDSRNNAVATAAELTDDAKDGEPAGKETGIKRRSRISSCPPPAATHSGSPAPRALVLYFYPKDNTPGCTTEGQQFRDLLPGVPEGRRASLRRLARQHEVARELQGEDGLPVRAAVRRGREARASRSTSSR